MQVGRFACEASLYVYFSKPKRDIGLVGVEGQGRHLANGTDCGRDRPTPHLNADKESIGPIRGDPSQRSVSPDKLPQVRAVAAEQDS